MSEFRGRYEYSGEPSKGPFFDHTAHPPQEPIEITFGMTYVSCGHMRDDRELGLVHSPAVVTDIGKDGYFYGRGIGVSWTRDGRPLYYADFTSGTLFRKSIVKKGLSDLTLPEEFGDRRLPDFLSVEDIVSGIPDIDSMPEIKDKMLIYLSKDAKKGTRVLYEKK